MSFLELLAPPGEVRLQERLEAASNISVAADRDEVDPVERSRAPDLEHHVAGELDPCFPVSFGPLGQPAGNGKLGELGAQLGRHLGTGYHHHPGVHRPSKVERGPPLQEVVD